MKKFLLTGLLVFSLAGCATLQKENVGEKSAIDVCASSGAALSALVITNNQKILNKIKPEAVIMKGVCNSKTPNEALSSAEFDAYEKIVEAASPYMGVN